jgi:hypothetical protein
VNKKAITEKLVLLENLLSPFTNKSVTFADGSVPHSDVIPGSNTIPTIKAKPFPDQIIQSQT